MKISGTEFGNCHKFSKTLIDVIFQIFIFDVYVVEKDVHPCGSMIRVEGRRNRGKRMRQFVSNFLLHLGERERGGEEATLSMLTASICHNLYQVAH